MAGPSSWGDRSQRSEGSSPGDLFGISTLEGGLLAVIARGAASRTGAAYVFSKSGGSWVTAGSLAELASAQVAGLVLSGVLNQGQGRALDAKLSGYVDALDRGAVRAAAGKARAFVGQVERLEVAGVLDAAAANPLVEIGTRAVALAAQG